LNAKHVVKDGFEKIMNTMSGTKTALVDRQGTSSFVPVDAFAGGAMSVRALAGDDRPRVLTMILMSIQRDLSAMYLRSRRTMSSNVVLLRP
jgi:hypothetical protein